MKELRNSFLSSVMIVALVSVGCGPTKLGQTSPFALKDSGSNSSTSTGGGSGGGATDPWSKIDTAGYVSGGPFDGELIISIDKVKNLLILSLPMPANPLGGAMSLDIPEFPGAFVSLDQLSSGAWAMNLNVPLRYLIKNFNFIAPATLPNGDPLPAIPGGELPRIAGHLQNTKVNIYMYGSVKYFALFVPTPGFNPYISLVLPIENAGHTKTLGYLASVPQKGSFDGGVYASFILPPELARLIDNL